MTHTEMTTQRIWILGAPDPEMETIEALLRECGERVAYVIDSTAQRVRAGDAYRARLSEPLSAAVIYEVECMIADHAALLSECRVTVDHHNPGDPGFGRTPAEFLAASSIGQVIAELARLRRLPDWPTVHAYFGSVRPGHIWHVASAQPYAVVIASKDTGLSTSSDDERGLRGSQVATARLIPHDLVLCAAADHCLGAAYCGECPGVDPDALMRWRAQSRARHQGRSVDDVLELARGAGAGRVLAKGE